MTSDSESNGNAFTAASHMKAARRERMCTNRHRYETEALALDAAVRRMAAVAEVPLYVYPCPYCVGFHLTSQNKDGTKVSPVLLHLGSGRIFMPHEAPGIGKRSRSRVVRHRRKVAGARREREEAGETYLANIPQPRVADPSEVADFFATHQRPAA